ncbi:hypothetical protein TNCV_473661 [Trichonephila clavipes]|nr:hypothetical protein TNCV_473661 [Trichonephila clavipes]
MDSQFGGHGCADSWCCITEKDVFNEHQDGHICDWRHRDERTLATCIGQYHNGQSPDVMEWHGVLLDTRVSCVDETGFFCIGNDLCYSFGCCGGSRCGSYNNISKF